MKIRPDELVFPETHVILGRGTFGLVLLAEYRYRTILKNDSSSLSFAHSQVLTIRVLNSIFHMTMATNCNLFTATVLFCFVFHRGTQVAVKRVIPPKGFQRSSSSKTVNELKGRWRVVHQMDLFGSGRFKPDAYFTAGIFLVPSKNCKVMELNQHLQQMKVKVKVIMRRKILLL